VNSVGNVTSYQVAGLVPSTTYSYRVRAVDAAGNVSGQSAAATATTQAVVDVTPPSVPTGLAASAVSATRIDLSWVASTDNTGVVGYRVYRNGVFLAALGNVTAYQSTGLAAATTYTYSVDAVDGAGNASNVSTSASATTLTPNTATLTWDAVIHPNLAGYRIYYGTAPGAYVQPVGSGVSVGNVVTFTVTGLTSGTRYYFAATAFDASNNESAFSNEVFKDIP
jgi:chitodextrinase